MSKSCMASDSSFNLCAPPVCENERPDLKSIRALLVSINQFIHEFLTNAESRTALRLRCASKLRNQKNEFFDEQSIISNLYWGIEKIDDAIQTSTFDASGNRLSTAEQMLQVPAMLDEHGETAGMPNRYLVCCSYFYLSVVKKLQGDEWQVALHFLQSLLVSPRLALTEFAQGFCYRLLLSFAPYSTTGNSESLLSNSLEFEDDDCGKSTLKQIARRCKDWLMYYQVMLYGETHQWQQGSSNLSPESRSHSMIELLTGIGASKETECGLGLPNLFHTGMDCTYHQSMKITIAEESENLCQSARSNPKERVISLSTVSPSTAQEQFIKETIMKSVSKKFSGPELCSMEQRDLEPSTPQNIQVEGKRVELSSKPCEFHVFGSVAPSPLSQFPVSQISNQNTAKGILNLSNSQKDLAEVYSHCRGNSRSELLGLIEKAISRLCLSEGLGNYDEDSAVEVSTIYKMLNNKAGIQYTMLKDLIMDQLVTGISTSKEEKIIRASVSLLTTIISENNAVIEDIKKKGLQLCDLATALKKNVHEAAILIYLISPSPREIKSLELLPVLVDVICTSKCYTAWSPSLLLTPPAASTMIIEIMVTAFDDDTNKMHLSEISSPSVLCGLLEVARTNNVESLVSLGGILVKCMQLDGECRGYISKFISMAPFIYLLQSDKKEAVHITLELFNEILQIPRSSAIELLKRIKYEGQSDIIHILMHCVSHLQHKYQLLAANILIQLILLDDRPSNSLLKEEAIKVLFRSVAGDNTSATQLLSVSILSNLGGTFAWTGEPYTVAWLLRKAGLSSDHLNMVKSFNWFDQSLQDGGVDSWSSLMARNIINVGESVFYALEMGLKSKIKKVSRDCLTTIAWLGCELAKCPSSIRCSACDILLGGIELFLYPGVELEERLLACLCIFNYASGKGMQKLTSFSEGVRESLRRLSHITWMAEELHQVADYLMPNNSRISCVHTQVLELGFNSSGAVCALIYYKGLLCSGYSDGSIKVWNIKGQTASLIWDIKKHRKAVTCFSHFESGESLLSGSVDKSIRVWKMIQGKLDCIDVIEFKEPIQHLGTYGQMIFAITHGHGLKVIDASRTTKVLFKSKTLKCMKVVQTKVYVGCTDASIQEFSMTNKCEQEIKPTSKSWRMNHKAINSLAVYKDWLFSASSMVQGSSFQNWRRQGKPEISIIYGKGDSVQGLSVVEDFVYLVCRSSVNSIQIWLRKTQQKVGRISAGSKITCLLTANDMVFCGTETGKIKGWIPL